MSLKSGSELGRTIGWRTGAAVTIANMIGAGIFTTSGFIARDTGSPWILLVLWATGGLVSLLGALAYAEQNGRKGGLVKSRKKTISASRNARRPRPGPALVIRCGIV
jgi:hypothetical protein